MRLVTATIARRRCRAARRARRRRCAAPAAAGLRSCGSTRHRLGEQRVERVDPDARPACAPARGPTGRCDGRRSRRCRAVGDGWGGRSSGAPDDGRVRYASPAVMVPESFSARSGFPRRRAGLPDCFPALPTRSVRWPERFRGGCSFGAPSLAASTTLPAGRSGEIRLSAGVRRHANERRGGTTESADRSPSGRQARQARGSHDSRPCHVRPR